MLPKTGLGNYLVSLANRFGWWFDADDNNKTFTVRYRKDVLTNRKKVDYTGKSTALYNSKISKGKIYRLEHAGASEKLDFTYLSYQGEVNNQYNLPAATLAIQHHTYLVRSENAWYTCTVDSTDIPKWEKASDNLPNYAPEDATEAVSTNMQLPGSLFIPYRNTALSELPQKITVPVVAISDANEVSEVFYSAFHHGLQNTIDNVGGPVFYFPFASAANYAPNGNRISNYALSWQFANGTGDEGMQLNYWKAFLDFIKQQELVTASLRWNMADVLNYRYENTIVIRNTEYLVSNLKVSLPLPEFTEAEMIRVT
jgi:hypothetical protein